MEIIYKVKAGEVFFNPDFDAYHFILNLYGIQSGIIVTEHTFNRPAWTISLTIVCYIIFFVVVSKAKKNYDNIVFIYMGWAILGLALLNSGLNYPIINGDIGRGISCFFIGVLLYKGYCKIRDKEYAWKIGYSSLIGAMILWGGARLFTFRYFWGNVQMVVILAFAPLMITAILLTPWLRKFFELPPFLWLGEISIPVYLWHMPVVCVVKIIEVYCLPQIDYSSYSVWVLYMLGVIGIAAIYHNIINEKYMELLQWLRKVISFPDENKKNCQ